MAAVLKLNTLLKKFTALALIYTLIKSSSYCDVGKEFATITKQQIV